MKTHTYKTNLVKLIGAVDIHGARVSVQERDQAVHRPVMITVGATVIALFPLASHGGPLWEPMCYAQIGGLSVATFITLWLVPVIYAIFVLDLKLVKWEKVEEKPDADSAHAPATV